MDTLNEARQKIDAVDAQLAALFEQRMEDATAAALINISPRGTLRGPLSLEFMT